MNVSHQTVLLIFGVTLAHLVAIAAFAPSTQPSRISHPTLFPDDSFVGPADEPAGDSATETAEAPAEPHPLPVTGESTAAAAGEPVDLPARFRELPESKPAPADEPVAEARAVPGGTGAPRVLTPLPRS
jgi:hypothetical protein